jgi:hypothetical protein
LTKKKQQRSLTASIWWLPTTIMWSVVARRHCRSTSGVRDASVSLRHPCSQKRGATIRRGE